MRIAFSAPALLVALLAFPLSATAQTQSSKQAPEKPAAASEQKAEKATRPLSPAREALQKRQRACADEWKLVKGTSKTKETTWPKFWSACNTRLKNKQG